MPLITCQQCGTVFTASPSDRRKFCSHACYARSKERKIRLDCEQCGKPFDTIQSEIDKAQRRNSAVRFCSRECHQASNKGAGNPGWKGGNPILECANCQNKFVRPRTWPDIFKHTFCSNACRIEYIRKHPEATPQWKGGVAVLHNGIRKHWSYLHWRKAVLERDDYTCKKCGKRGVRLNVHHLYEFSEYPEHRLVLENGHTLCKSCHLTVKGHERDYRISLSLPADDPQWEPYPPLGNASSNASISAVSGLSGVNSKLG